MVPWHTYNYPSEQAYVYNFSTSTIEGPLEKPNSPSKQEKVGLLLYGIKELHDLEL